MLLLFLFFFVFFFTSLCNNRRYRFSQMWFSQNKEKNSGAGTVWLSECPSLVHTRGVSLSGSHPWSGLANHASRLPLISVPLGFSSRSLGFTPISRSFLVSSSLAFGLVIVTRAVSPSFPYHCRGKCVQVFCLCAYLCTMYVPGAHGGQKSTSDLLEVKLQIIVSVL